MQSEVALTIAVPSYNRRHSLAQLLSKISSQLNDRDDLLVVDDGSTDGSADEAANFARVRLVRHTFNRGMVPTWNSCLREAQRDWICVVHNDDIVADGGLETIRRVIGHHPDAGLIAHRQTPRLEAKLHYEWWEAGPSAVLNSTHTPSGATVSRAAVEQLGMFDEAFAYSADIEYFARLAARFDIAVIRSPAVVNYQLHDQNHQYATWRRPDFFEQLGDIEQLVMSYASFGEGDAPNVRSARWTQHLIYMFRAAHRIGDRALLRKIGRMLRQRPDAGRRLRALAHIAAAAGWCPPVKAMRF